MMNKRTDFAEFTSKIPPQATDLEEVILGAMLLENHCIDEILKVLPEDAFYKEAHQIVYRAIGSLWKDRKNVDVLTVSNWIRSSGNLELVGGAYFVSQLTQRVASSANVNEHCFIILQKYLQREVIREATSMITMAYEDSSDIFEILQKAEAHLSRINELLNKQKTISFNQEVDTTIIQLIKLQKKEIENFGIQTGLTAVDKFTTGRIKGELSIIAGRTSMGKTTRVVQEIINVAIYQKIPIGFISMESKANPILIKMLCNLSGINSASVKIGSINTNELNFIGNQAEVLKNDCINFIDNGGLTIDEVALQARLWKKKHNIQILYIDYLTLIKGRREHGQNRDQEIGTISRGLKMLAMDLDIAVVCLAQLSREVEKREGKRPMLSDLRESGNIEQDADNVSFLFRPEYYGIKEDSQGNSTEGVLHEIIAKNRNGSTGVAVLRCDLATSKITDLNSF